ncbi:MAG: hypothetical protein CNE99_03925 [OM182 bacterium MED-G24]|uniref:Molybdopterin dinucleotide-binding domain-containing protein n=1 Tax=OM182 bacterium MED-G24 TaxID=1986255 RepID=A0A2A5WV71_9GAMM|nr:MAG: hypothetical protein CNE99_03925 [OM182 bacterium MED-G24]
MSFANTKRIYEGLMKQDLIVAYEHMITPTEQLGDYVLPGDSWLERPSMMVGISDQAMQPPGECRSIVHFWHELARRMGLENEFPWQTPEELLDYRLEPGNTTWAEVVASGSMPKMENPEKKYEKTGFATSTGKVELYSTIIDDLSFDPLPCYREASPESEEYPLCMFIVLPDDEYYRTGHRHIPDLRKRAQDPAFFVNKADLSDLGLEEGYWARIETLTGRMVGRAFIRSGMPKGLVRVPHGWWKPEAPQGLSHMSGMWSFSDAQTTPDEEPDLIDLEQGIPHMKGVPCRLTKLTTAEVKKLESVFGETLPMPNAVEKNVPKRESTKDFMADIEFGEDVELQAVELSLYGRSSG